MIIDDETVAVAAVLGYFLGVVVTIIVENKGFSKRKANPPKKRKGSVPKMFDPPSERIATLKTALYRTRRDRDKYKELYLSEKERAYRHMERLRERNGLNCLNLKIKTNELQKSCKENDLPGKHVHRPTYAGTV